ncbi:MAG: hypothetical protein Q8O61_15835, partial [Nocardioides sp.]|nr:hypothetical protein [Nocardioides sp.]
PTGVRGLRWVFPAFRPQSAGCRDVLADNPTFQGPTMWACEAEISGSPVLITYSELSALADGLDYLQQTYDDSQQTVVAARGGAPLRYEWRRPFEDGFTVISLYAEHPFAVEVRAEDRGIREQALATVRFRPPGAISYR